MESKKNEGHELNELANRGNNIAKAMHSLGTLKPGPMNMKLLDRSFNQGGTISKISEPHVAAAALRREPRHQFRRFSASIVTHLLLDSLH